MIIDRFGVPLNKPSPTISAKRQADRFNSGRKRERNASTALVTLNELDRQIEIADNDILQDTLRRAHALSA
jgi:hypothetical protein